MTATELPGSAKSKRAAPVDRPTNRAGSIATVPAKGSPAFLSTTLAAASLGSLLLYAAFPPLNLPWLAWVAPVPWLWLIGLPRLPGNRPYVALWLAGFGYWLLMLQGIRLAHPALYAGWIALAAYLGVYLPFLVALARVGVHQLRMPLIAIAPMVWVGLELLRGHLFTGFSLALLAHTQAEIPSVIQIADLVGGYGLSFAMVFVAACIASMRPRRGAGIRWWPGAAAASAIAGVLMYGSWRINELPPGASAKAAKVALIQGSIDTVFDTDMETATARMRQTFEHYRDLTQRATSAHADLDLVVWPESMFVIPERLAEEPLAPLTREKLSAEQLRNSLGRAQEEYRAILADEVARVNERSAAENSGTQLVLGTTTFVYGAAAPRMYNSVLLVSPGGEVAARYFKTHAVMFGEYIPFADFMPWLYSLTPMTGGLSVGDGPAAFEVAGLRMVPSVCFESTVPQLIRGHVLELWRKQQPADVLLNVTNDGWFWGSAILDLHFRCAIFRAVENRKPMLIAANTGVSGWIDGNGVVRERGERRRAEVLIAKVAPDGRWSPYFFVGDWPAALCALFCIVLAGCGRFQSAAGSRESPQSSQLA